MIMTFLEKLINSRIIIQAPITQPIGKNSTYGIFMEIIATFLTEWLTRHVFGIDKKLEDYILHSSAK